MTATKRDSALATAWLLPRLAALLIDMLLVLALTELAVAAAYNLTGGRVQGSLGFAFTSCEPVSQLPELTPPAPDGLTYAVRCERSLFGLAMASSLNLGRVVQSEDGRQLTAGYSYTLDPAGRQVEVALTVGSVHAVILLIAYLALSDWRWGASIGKRVMRLRTVDLERRYARGLPLARVLLRHVAMQAGPLLLLCAWVLDPLLRPALQAAERSALQAALFWPLVGGWLFWNAMRLTIKSQPLYDLAAGTTVVLADAISDR